MIKIVTGFVLAVALSFFSGSGFAQTSAKEPVPNGWHLKDYKETGAYGISLDKAYKLVKGKKSQTVIEQ
jgi:hypothetical protein